MLTSVGGSSLSVMQKEVDDTGRMLGKNFRLHIIKFFVSISLIIWLCIRSLLVETYVQLTLVYKDAQTHKLINS